MSRIEDERWAGRRYCRTETIGRAHIDGALIGRIELGERRQVAWAGPAQAFRNARYRIVKGKNARGNLNVTSLPACIGTFDNCEHGWALGAPDGI